MKNKGLPIANAPIPLVRSNWGGKTMESKKQKVERRPVELNDAEIAAVAGGDKQTEASTGVKG